MVHANYFFSVTAEDNLILIGKNSDLRITIRHDISDVFSIIVS